MNILVQNAFTSSLMCTNSKREPHVVVVFSLIFLKVQNSNLLNNVLEESSNTLASRASISVIVGALKSADSLHLQ